MTCGSEPHSQTDYIYKSQVKLFYRSTDLGVWSIGSKLTSIPAPKILKDWKGGDHSLMLMECVLGEPLSTAWRKLSAEERENIAKQTADYLLQLRELQSDYLQKICPRGPFASDEELWKEMEGALHDSVPEAVRRLLRRRMPPVTPYTFTHGDLSYGDIVVKDGPVTGIIDWETAAYMPVWYEVWRILLRNCMPDYDVAYNLWHHYQYLCLDSILGGRHPIDEASR
ncbi:kinase-like protein [Aspergillus eucalypticola CBS 122712]|uniref:Kinase-like protein n=1 Tax=Aspergillus eucalypticola (strain CBS 122712 / IBT 29274) TaxID=1448314 RepID=A0A317VBI1_ASPEC|nr:kinase-like protein [Aspergillus eucalypticola CBS 122712]PWY70739.1 kinase-like protein [Aspergillus eucalypticola CBS 122712]